MKTAFKLAILSSILFPSALVARDFAPHEVAPKLDQKKNEIQVKYKLKQNGELNAKQGEGDSLASVGSKTATLEQDKDQIQEDKSNEAEKVLSTVSSKVSSVAGNVSSYLVRNQ